MGVSHITIHVGHVQARDNAEYIMTELENVPLTDGEQDALIERLGCSYEYDKVYITPLSIALQYRPSQDLFFVTMVASTPITEKFMFDVKLVINIPLSEVIDSSKNLIRTEVLNDQHIALIKDFFTKQMNKINWKVLIIMCKRFSRINENFSYTISMCGDQVIGTDYSIVSKVHFRRSFVFRGESKGQEIDMVPTMLYNALTRLHDADKERINTFLSEFRKYVNLVEEHFLYTFSPTYNLEGLGLLSDKSQKSVKKLYKEHWESKQTSLKKQLNDTYKSILKLWMFTGVDERYGYKTS